MPVISPRFMISQKTIDDLVMQYTCRGTGADRIAARKNVSLGGPFLIEKKRRHEEPH